MREQQQKSLTQINGEEWVLQNYPLLSNRKEPVMSLAIALQDKNSLALLDKQLGEGIALKWVKAQLLDTFRILGASESMYSLQVVVIARRIRNIYYYLSASEMTYFLEALIGGSYGTVYVGKTINPQNIMEALKKFDEERANTISEIEYEEHSKMKKEENKPANLDFVNEICKRFTKEYKKTHMGCNAPKPYTPFKKKGNN